MDDDYGVDVELDAGLPELELIAPHAYTHVTKALYDTPWAVQRQMLTTMVNVVQFRADGGSYGPEEIAERLEAARASQGPRAGSVMVGPVAVIPMYGLLSQRMTLMADISGGTSVDQLRAALRDALSDPTVKAVVFDIDSPGGAVDGITEFATELRATRAGPVPIVGQVNTLAASAAYWLASQMSEVVVTPSGEVGSVGVFAVHQDFSQAGALAGINTTLISAGKYKVEGNEFEPLTDEGRTAIQEQVDAFYHMFLSDVAKGRKVTISDVESKYGEGRTLLAAKALAAGMVDRIDTLEATVRRFQPKVPVARPAAGPQQAAVAASVRRANPAWNAAHAAPQRRRLSK